MSDFRERARKSFAISSRYILKGRSLPVRNGIGDPIRQRDRSRLRAHLTDAVPRMNDRFLVASQAHSRLISQSLAAVIDSLDV